MRCVRPISAYSMRAFVLAALSARGDDRDTIREPSRGAGGRGPCSRPAGVRTRMGWEGWVPLNEREPNQASRAAPLVPGLALRRQPALGITRELRRLKCVRTAPACAGTGEAAARPGGAPIVAPETGRRKTPRHRLART